MRDRLIRPSGAAMLAAALLVLAGCGREDAHNQAADNGLGNDLGLETVGNDASAMEAAGTAAPADSSTGGPAANMTGTATGNGTGSGDPGVLGDTSGGDTGGNSADSNVTGM